LQLHIIFLRRLECSLHERKSERLLVR
jgi:hypothetical protein